MPQCVPVRGGEGGAPVFWAYLEPGLVVTYHGAQVDSVVGHGRLRLGAGGVLSGGMFLAPAPEGHIKLNGACGPGQGSRLLRGRAAARSPGLEGGHQLHQAGQHQVCTLAVQILERVRSRDIYLQSI